MSKSDDRKRCTLFEGPTITLQDMFEHEEDCNDEHLGNLTDEQNRNIVRYSSEQFSARTPFPEMFGQASIDVYIH